MCCGRHALELLWQNYLAKLIVICCNLHCCTIELNLFLSGKFCKSLCFFLFATAKMLPVRIRRQFISHTHHKFILSTLFQGQGGIHFPHLILTKMLWRSRVQTSFGHSRLVVIFSKWRKYLSLPSPEKEE